MRVPGSRLVAALVLLGSLAGAGAGLQDAGESAAIHASASGVEASATPTVTPAPPVLGFASESYAFKAEEFDATDPAKLPKVQIVSHLGRAVKAEVLVALRAPGQTVEQTFDVDIPAGARRDVILDLEPELEDAKYTGDATAYVPGVGPVVRASINVGPPPPPERKTVAAKPAVSKLQLQATRRFPWENASVHVDDAVVPLTEPAKPGTKFGDLTIAKKRVLGELPSDNNGSVTVRARKVDELQLLGDPGIPALSLALSDFDGPGTYTGDVDLVPGDDKAGTVALTVVVTDLFVWPALMILAGLFVALFGRRLAGVMLPLLRMRGRAAEVENAVAAAVKAMPPEGAYDTRADVEVRLTALRSKVRSTWRKRTGDAIEPGDRAALEKELEALEAHAEDLAAYPALAKSVSEALDEVAALTALGRFLPTGVDSLPTWLVATRRLLEGGEVEVDTFAKNLAQLRAAAEVAVWWKGRHPMLRRAAMWLRQLQVKGVEFKPAAAGLHAAWTTLWLAEDAEAVKDPELRVALDEAHAELLLLLEELEEPHRRELVLLGASFVADQAEEEEPETEPPPPDEPGEPAESPEAIGGQIAALNSLLIATALATALFTGLTALYFKEQFGTWTDYASAFFWGLTTGAAVDLLLEAFATERAPAEADKD